MNDTTYTLETLAGTLARCFEYRTRDNGDQFATLKDDAAPALLDMLNGSGTDAGDVTGSLLYHTHDDGQMFPDDWRYSMTWDALDRIAEGSDPYEQEPPYANHVLLEWAATQGRYDYADEALKEGADTIMGALAQGWLAEWMEVYDATEEWLTEYIDGQEEDEDEDA